MDPELHALDVSVKKRTHWVFLVLQWVFCAVSAFCFIAAKWEPFWVAEAAFFGLLLGNKLTLITLSVTAPSKIVDETEEDSWLR